MLAHFLGPAHHFGDFLGRHLDIFELIFEALASGLLADGFGDLLLEVRIGVHNVPARALVDGARRRLVVLGLRPWSRLN